MEVSSSFIPVWNEIVNKSGQQLYDELSASDFDFFVVVKFTGMLT